MATKEMRAVYAETLVELAAADPRIVVLEADLMRATGTGIFKAAYPDRCFNRVFRPHKYFRDHRITCRGLQFQSHNTQQFYREQYLLHQCSAFG